MIIQGDVNMDSNILPLGTIVTLKNGDDSKLMIVSRGSIVENNRSEVYFDYGAVLVPQGMLSPEAVYFFNKENVDIIIFEGFKNEQEIEFEKNYDSMISKAKYPKGSI